MATPADYLDTADLKNIAAGGFVREDVLAKIQDASTGIKPVFVDMIGRSPVSNSYSEWSEDALEDPDTANAVVSGADATVAAQAMPNAARVGNHAQTSIKLAAVSERAQNTNNLQSDALGYRTMRKLMELKRDVEAISLSDQASVADDGATVAGNSAGLGAWIKTHSFSGVGGSAGGFNNSTKVVDAPTPGTPRSIALADIRTAIAELYDEGVGENGLVVMSTPAVIAAVSEALRTDESGNFVSPVANISGTEGQIQYAQGWTSQFITDFGVRCKLVANRLQPTVDDGYDEVANLYIFDPDFLALGFLHDFKVEPLAKIGLSHRKMLSVDWTLKVLLERACAVIRDVDVAAPIA